MSDKVQKIREEIERRIKEGSSKNDISEGALALDSLLNFIDSLPEKVSSEDLEEELHNFLIEQGPMATLERCAKHFAEWQKEKHKTQYGFLNLKDCKDAYNEWKSTQDNPSAALAWVRACEWQKNQMKEALQTEYEKGRFDMREEMMKNTVEGVIDIRKWPAKAQVEFYDRLPVFNVRTGDKVKIIIV